ncbi:MAG: TonB-dependent receptor plug domain-containing protein, partial [Chitinophagaceae bacterium]
AGVINIITKKSGTKLFSINGTAHYGSYNTWRTHLGINGKSKIFDYNIGYSHFSTDGFSEAKQAFNSSALFDRDNYRQNSVQANFGIQANKNIRIQPYLRYNKNKGSLDTDAFTDELDFNYDAKNLQTGVKNIFELGKAQLNVVYQFNKTKRNYLDDSLKSRNGFYIYNQASFDASEHFGEAFLVYPFHSFKLTAGADIRSSEYDYNALQVSPFSTQKTATSGDSINHNQVGVYAALNYNSNAFNIEGGGRFNNHSEYGSNLAFNINPSYAIKNRLKVFSNASSGYKTPSLFQLYSEFGNQKLEPETSLNLEGGVEYFTKNGKANVKASYFNRRVKEVITFFFDPVSFEAAYINQDKQKDHGFELEGKISIAEKIQLKAVYSYVDGEITTKQNGKDTTYFNLIRRPKSILNISLGSQVTKGLFVSTQFNVVGKRKDIYFDPVTFQQQDISLKSYVLLNFYAEYGFWKDRLKLFADVR